MDILNRRMLAIQCNLTQNEVNMISRLMDGKQKITDYIYSDSVAVIHRIVVEDQKLFISTIGCLIRSGEYVRRALNNRIIICDRSALCVDCQLRRKYVTNPFVFRRFTKRLCIECNEIRDHAT